MKTLRRDTNSIDIGSISKEFEGVMINSIMRLQVKKWK